MKTKEKTETTIEVKALYLTKNKQTVIVATYDGDIIKIEESTNPELLSVMRAVGKPTFKDMTNRELLMNDLRLATEQVDMAAKDGDQKRLQLAIIYIIDGMNKLVKMLDETKES